MRRAARPLAIVALSVVFLVPLVFLVLGALRRPGLAPPDGFEWLPDPITWMNYGVAFGLVPLASAIRNSLFVAAVAVPVTVLIGSAAGFTIVTAKPRARRWLIVLSLIALVIPLSSLWVPRFVMFRWIGLIDSHIALMAPALMATTPFFVLLFALAYSRIPRTLFEAAELEGTSRFMTWWRVALPLARPALFAVSVLAFVWHWSNFVDPLLYITSEEKATVPLVLRALQSLEPTNHSIFLAGAVVAAIPPLLAFLLAQGSLFRRTIER